MMVDELTVFVACVPKCCLLQGRASRCCGRMRYRTPCLMLDAFARKGILTACVCESLKHRHLESMKLILGAIAGFVAGATLTKRHKNHLEKIETGTKNSIARKLLGDGRRSLIIAHTIVRVQLSRAFISTAR
jgi:hypothetical protein